MLGGKVEEGEQSLPVLCQTSGCLLVLGAVFVGEHVDRRLGRRAGWRAKLMVFKLVDAAAKTWRRLKGENQLPKVIAGIKFQNGIEVIKMPAHHAA